MRELLVNNVVTILRWTMNIQSSIPQTEVQLWVNGTQSGGYACKTTSAFYLNLRIRAQTSGHSTSSGPITWVRPHVGLAMGYSGWGQGGIDCVYNMIIWDVLGTMQ